MKEIIDTSFSCCLLGKVVNVTTLLKLWVSRRHLIRLGGLTATPLAKERRWPWLAPISYSFMCAHHTPLHINSTVSPPPSKHSKELTMSLLLQCVEDMLLHLDVEQTGKVKTEALLKELQSNADLDTETAKAFIARHDKDGDGSLDKEELLDFFRSLSFWADRSLYFIPYLYKSFERKL